MLSTRISDLKKCRDIASAYLDKDIKQLSSVKKMFSDSFYNGEHSTNFIRDWLAGGSSNNFAWGKFRRSDYANFSQFIDAICLEAPEEKAITIIKELSEVNDIQRIQQIVLENKEYLSSKCYYDLLMDLGFESDINQEHNSTKRKAETESQRISKIMCVLYAIPQGLIEAAAIKGIPFIAALTMPWSMTAMISIFFIAAFINYTFGRDDTTKFILRWKMGNLFKREIVEDNKNETIDFTKAEKRIVITFSVLSLLAALCVFSLGVISVQAYLPFIPALIVSSTLLVPTSLMFTNMVYKLIDHNGLDGIKDYFKTKFIQPWDKNKLKVVFEVGKLLFSLIVSVLVCGASYFLYHGKIVKFVGETALKAAAPVVSLIAAGITSVVKSLFSVSKITELLELAGNYIFKSKKNTSAEKTAVQSYSQEHATTAKIFQGLKTKARLISGWETFKNLIALGGHVSSETSLVWGELNAGYNNLTSVEKYSCTGGKFFYSGATTGRPFVGSKHDKSIKYHVSVPQTSRRN